MTTNGGSNFGLQLELYVGSNYIEPRKQSCIRLYVHHPSINPVLFKEGIHVSSSTETNVLIHQTNLNRLPAPYSNCIEDITLPDELKTDIALRTLVIDKIYTHKYCTLLCFNDYIIRKCGKSINQMTLVEFDLSFLKIFSKIGVNRTYFLYIGLKGISE